MNIPGYLLRKLRARWSGEHLQSVTFALTYRCNLACKTCGAWPKGNDPALFELNASEILNVVEQLPALSVRDVFLVGSEVLLFEGLLDVICRLRELNLRWSLLTNASLIDDTTAAAILVNQPRRITVSIDGGETVNDMLRGRGSYARAIAGLEKLENARTRLSINTTELGVHMTLSRFNVDQVRQVAQVCKARGWVFSVQAASHATKDDIENSTIDGLPAATNRFLPRLAYGFREPDIIVLRRAHADLVAAGQFVPSLHLVTSLPVGPLVKGQFPIGKCRTVQRELLIEPDGRVVICANLDNYPVGNVREQSLDEIWRSVKRRRLTNKVGAEGPAICATCCNYPDNLSASGYARAGLRYLRNITSRQIRRAGRQVEQ